MLAASACDALQGGKRLELRYNGFSRVVEVHAVGVAKNGSEIMQVWQVRGGSNSGELAGWKTMRLDEVLTAVILDEKSEAPRTGYERNARQFRRVLCQR